MSIAIAHFAIGASFGIIFLFMTGLYKTWLRSMIPFIFGFVSMIPDIHHVIPESIFSILVEDIHNSYISDLFFLHRTIDLLDPNDTKMFAFYCLVNLMVLLSSLWFTIYKYNSDNLE
jgi:hypothetical protein